MRSIRSRNTRPSSARSGLREAIAGWAKRRLDVTLDPDDAGAARRRLEGSHLPPAPGVCSAADERADGSSTRRRATPSTTARRATPAASPPGRAARGQRLPARARARSAARCSNRRASPGSTTRTIRRGASVDLGLPARAGRRRPRVRHPAVRRRLLSRPVFRRDRAAARASCRSRQTGVLSFGSLSKRSGMTGYRSGLHRRRRGGHRRAQAGPPELRRRLAELRPGRGHRGVVGRCPRRRAAGDLPRQARPAGDVSGRAGYDVSGSQGAIYLWVRVPVPRRRCASSRGCWSTASWSARASRSAPAARATSGIALVPTLDQIEPRHRGLGKDQPVSLVPPPTCSSLIEAAFAEPSRLDQSEHREAVEATIDGLDRGELRLAEKPAPATGSSIAWVQQAILLYFRMRQLETSADRASSSTTTRSRSNTTTPASACAWSRRPSRATAAFSSRA